MTAASSSCSPGVSTRGGGREQLSYTDIHARRSKLAAAATTAEESPTSPPLSAVGMGDRSPIASPTTSSNAMPPPSQVSADDMGVVDRGGGARDELGGEAGKEVGVPTHSLQNKSEQTKQEQWRRRQAHQAQQAHQAHEEQQSRQARLARKAQHAVKEQQSREALQERQAREALHVQQHAQHQVDEAGGIGEIRGRDVKITTVKSRASGVISFSPERTGPTVTSALSAATGERLPTDVVAAAGTDETDRTNRNSACLLYSPSSQSGRDALTMAAMVAMAEAQDEGKGKDAPPTDSAAPPVSLASPASLSSADDSTHMSSHQLRRKRQEHLLRRVEGASRLRAVAAKRAQNVMEGGSFESLSPSRGGGGGGRYNPVQRNRRRP